MAMLILWLAVSISTVLCDVISSSRLESCTQSSTDDGIVSNCDQRFMVLLSLSGTESSSQIVASVNEANAEGSGGVVLEKPIVISCSVGETKITYPLIFKRYVNGDPYEEIIYYPSLFDRCNDNRGGNPSCGWASDNDGNVIEDSQGFCCKCEFMDLFRPEGDTYRGDLECNLFSWASSAHCMRQSELWYGLFEFGEAIVETDITCNVETDGAVETLQLSSTSPVVRSASEKIVMKLEGEFNTFSLKRSLTSRYLLAPMMPDDDPRYLEGQHGWLTVPIDEVGTECDRIGVSFASFRYQNNGCGRAPGSCLTKTPEALYRADLESISSGGEAAYLLTSFGDIIPTQVGNQFLSVSFRPEKTGISTSLLSVSIIADNISFVASESPAKILEGSVDPFTAMSANGVMKITVQNIGSLKSNYILQASNCSPVVNPVSPQTFTLGAQEVQTRRMDISVTTVLSDTLFCDVQITTATSGKIYDVLRVWFIPNELVVEPPSSNGQDGSYTTRMADPSQCFTKCAANVLCYFTASCIMYVIIIIVVIVAVVFIIVCCRKKKCCTHCFKCCCCCCISLYKRHKKTEKAPKTGESTKVTPAVSPKMTPMPNPARSNVQSPKLLSPNAMSPKTPMCIPKTPTVTTDPRKLPGAIIQKVFLHIIISETNKTAFINFITFDELPHKIAVRGELIQVGGTFYYEPVPRTTLRGCSIPSRFRCVFTREQIAKSIASMPREGYDIIN